MERFKELLMISGSLFAVMLSGLSLWKQLREPNNNKWKNVYDSLSTLNNWKSEMEVVIDKDSWNTRWDGIYAWREAINKRLDDGSSSFRVINKELDRNSEFQSLVLLSIEGLLTALNRDDESKESRKMNVLISNIHQYMADKSTDRMPSTREK
jgi:hypothetical protein